MSQYICTVLAHSDSMAVARHMEHHVIAVFLHLEGGGAQLKDGAHERTAYGNSTGHHAVNSPALGEGNLSGKRSRMESI